ncbi:MAG: TetR/AcrR family transcriptional regulator [Thermoguttaceae bacterium]
MRLSKARKECVTAMMKDTIFTAASSLLEEHGAGGLTMDRVATSVGLTAGSLYTYFRDKDELLQYFYSRLVEPALESAAEIAKTDLPAPKKLENFLYTAWEYAVRHKGVLQLLAGINQDASIRQSTRPRILSILVPVFQQGIDEGSFRPHDPNHTARMYLACLSELFELQAEGASGQQVDGFAKMLIDATVHGFSIQVSRDSAETEPKLASF